ncbi:hypothetical protein Y1Q_0017366 [Alligator mississippiensis]|uniref:C-type lectin domain-containing protein n=1 Tax=Alligator mississippiensis TaxID=8496 RepID=A0A151NGF7_ALLMI|nr:hypothetical protein Y1Q_0017366 [Alligator mississippiensis]
MAKETKGYEFQKQRFSIHSMETNYSDIRDPLPNLAGDKCKICPKNWIQYGKACYDISSGIKSWSECKKYCSSLSSRLLKIDSKEELNVLKPVTYLACWMGSFYDEAKGSWQWEDGTTLSSDV